MPNGLRLLLLGPPQIFLDDQPITGLSSSKARALLFYLAVSASSSQQAEPLPQSRDRIAALLWSELSNTKARQNLRTVLPELRRTLGDYLRIERNTIAFNSSLPYWLDVAEIRRTLSRVDATSDLSARQDALALYRGEFLEGFHVQNAPAFEEWLLSEREQIHTLIFEGSFDLTQRLIEQNDLTAALQMNRRTLELEPWSEPVHRQQMLLLAKTGQRSAALSQYEECRRILREEFQVDPLPVTTELYEEIRSGALLEGATEPMAMEEATSDGNVLPSTTVELSADEVDVEEHGVQQPIATDHALPQAPRIHGRKRELATLFRWIVEEGCHLVGIFGIGGQGKTTLATAFVHSINDMSAQESSRLGFDRVIWQSLRNAPTADEVLLQWIVRLSGQSVTRLPSNLDQQIALLVDFLRRQRSLIVLDNLESIMQDDQKGGSFRSGFEEYEQVIAGVAAGGHQSCFLLTGRQRLRSLRRWEEENPSVRTLSLPGLSVNSAKALLVARGLTGTENEMDALIHRYSGNPLALNLVAETVQEIFEGKIPHFLENETLVFDDIRHVLDQQFARLTELERDTMTWLAVAREPQRFNRLRNLFATPPDSRRLLEAVRSLTRHSLVEDLGRGIELQNVVLEYVTERLTDEFTQECLAATGNIEENQRFVPDVVNRFSLCLAQVQEYVRNSQRRQLLDPVLRRLVDNLGHEGATLHLQTLLAQLRLNPPPRGYAATNILHLLLVLGADLRRADLSNLYFRELYLRGTSLPEVNCSNATFVDAVFTEPLGLIYGVTFSPGGDYVAAGSSDGDIYIWRTADQQLVRILHTEGQAIQSLSTAQERTQIGDGQLMLAYACLDGSIGLWPISPDENGAEPRLLLDERQRSILSVKLKPDAQEVVAIDIEGQVFHWRSQAIGEWHMFQQHTTIPTRRGLIAFSAEAQFVAVGSRDGVVHVLDLESSEVLFELRMNTSSMTALAMNQDHNLLVAGDTAGHITMWDLESSQIVQEIQSTSAAIDALAFRADGKMLVSTHGVCDHSVRLWQLDQERTWRLDRTLLGHDHIIWDVTFGLTSPRRETQSVADKQHLLVSGGSDQTVRVWDVKTGHALYTMRGLPRALSAIATFPVHGADDDPNNNLVQNSRFFLAAVGYDGCVHRWDVQNNQGHVKQRTLESVGAPLYAVATSQDGRMIAGAGHDSSIYLWDHASGDLIQRLQGHMGSIECVAIHPTGRLLASGGVDGELRIWELYLG